MTEDQGQPAPTEDIEIEQIFNEIIDAPGYVVFVACIDPDKKGQGGAPMLNFKYRRYHFPTVDLLKALENFAKHAGEDLSNDQMPPAPQA